jgi:membrane protein involved in colicin uptake
MSTGTLIKAGAAITATVAMIAGGPGLANSLGLTEDSVAALPASWETQRAVDAQSAAASNDATLKAEAERKAAERRAKKEAERKAAERKRRAAEQRAARARAAQGGSPAQNRALGMQMCADKGWSASQCNDLGTLWQKESGWSSRAHNGSGAHGIPQALPGSKMASAGPNWQSNARTQIAWGLGYIASRYGNPSNALAHSYSTGWY